MKYDLHVHTNFSDGKFNPSEIIDLALERGLDGVAITDHDTVSGIEEAVDYNKKHDNFKIIPGIELGCIYNKEEVHILGYFIDYTSKELLETIKILKENRNLRGYKIIEKLKRLNIDINKEEIQSLTREDFIGRFHIAKLMVEKQYVSNIPEAFEKYLNIDAPAYVPKKTLTIKESIDLINRNNGIAVLAHPGILKNKKNIINYCIKSGIQGIESIHSKHSKEDVEFFKNLARKNDLLITGGSDCHGQLFNNELLLGKFYIDEKEMLKIEESI